MKFNSESLLLIVVFLGYFFMYLFLMPTYENPDEWRHLWNIFNSDELYNLKGSGGLYNHFMKIIAELFNFQYNQEYRFNSIIKNANLDFKYFGNEYRFKHESIFPRVDILIYRMSNLILLLPLFWWFLKDRENRKLFSIALIFPGFMWFLTCFNPDVLNIIFSIIIFKNFDKPKWKIILFCSIGFIFLDRSIILLFMALITVYIYQTIAKSNKMKIVFWLLFFLSLIAFYGVSKNIISLEYKYEPIKSIFTAVVSFYGLLGNMSIRATFFEYIVMFSVIGLLIFNKLLLKKEHHNFEKINTFTNLLAFFTVFWVYLIVLVPTLDQGRYFYPIIFYFIYVINELVIKNKIKKIDTFVFLSVITNLTMFGKLLYIYITR